MRLMSKPIMLSGVLFLAACGGSDTAAVAVGAIEEALGPDFFAMFSADANSDPVDAQSVAITPVSYTTDPFNP